MTRQSAASSGQPHIFELRVYYEDTDAGGVVYHASYLRFAERARTEMLRTLGWDHVRLRRELALFFVVRSCEMDCLKPALLDDTLEVATSLLSVGGASMDLQQVVRRSALEIVRLTVRLALVTTLGRPARLPPVLRLALDPLLDCPPDTLNPEPVYAR